MYNKIQVMPKSNFVKLSNKFRGKTVTVKSVDFHNPDVLHKLQNIGIVEGSRVHVLDYDKNEKFIHLQINGVEYVLREEDCDHISVQ